MIQEPTWPGTSLFAVTKSDDTVFNPPVRQLYVGTGGDVVVTGVDDVDVTFKNVADGQYIGPFFIKKVKAATTAADIVAFV